MMAAILNSAMLDSDTAILDSDTLLSSLRLTQKHSHSTLTLTQTNSIWLIWWLEPSWILPSWIQPFCTKLWLKLIQSDSDSFILTQLDDVRHHEFCHLGFNHFEEKKLHSFIVTQLDDGSHLRFSHFAQKNFTHSFWLNLMMSAILNSAMLDSDTAILDSDTLLSSLRFTQKHSHYSLTLTQINSIWLKLIHSYLTWWCQPSWNLPSWIQPFGTKRNFTHSFWPNFMMAAILNTAILDSEILHKTLSQTNSFSLNLLMSDILNSAILDSANLYKKKLHSFILTQLYDGSHLEFYHLWFNYFAQQHFTHTFWLILMMAAILNSAM